MPEAEASQGPPSPRGADRATYQSVRGPINPEVVLAPQGFSSYRPAHQDLLRWPASRSGGCFRPRWCQPRAARQVSTQAR